MTRVQCIKSVHEHFPPSKTALVSELWIVISEVLNQHVLFGQRTHTQTKGKKRLNKMQFENEPENLCFRREIRYEHGQNDHGKKNY